MTASPDKPVLILGGGINGAAIARELALNSVPVCLVESADLASGTTAYSSRLIHGGLRYLEYGECGLVRESLEERSRLLRLAPDYVHPLRLFIPIASRASGWLGAAQRVLRLPGQPFAPAPRGLWLVGCGLWLYDRFSRDPLFPGRAVHAAGEGGMLPVNRRFRWLYSYHDAQMPFPERFVVALLDDARQLAAERGVAFDVRTYCRATLHKGVAELREAGGGGEVVQQLEPAAIVNATGAWVDRTLQSLRIPERRLIGGTKGTHCVTFHPGLREMLGGRGVYAEAADGRPVFILPWCDGVLLGTTDVPYEGDPVAATASEEEVEYLLGSVNDVFPDARLSRDDVAMHYAGVRPLPYVDQSTPAAITRRHWLEAHRHVSPPVFSVVGGKLTTCRSLAEQAAVSILSRLGRRPEVNSRDRPLGGFLAEQPGGTDPAAGLRSLADRWQCDADQVRAVWALCGKRAEGMWARGLGDGAGEEGRECLADSCLPRRFVRSVIREEWVARLADLVERRLMLLYDQRLSLRCLRELAGLMVQEGALPADRAGAEVDACRRRLESHFGRRIEDAERE